MDSAIACLHPSTHSSLHSNVSFMKNTPPPGIRDLGHVSELGRFLLLTIRFREEEVRTSIILIVEARTYERNFKEIFVILPNEVIHIVSDH